MKCEEFEAIGLDAERDASLSEVERGAAREHASTCSRCAALQDSWQAAGVELRAFAEDTAVAQAPARVEMRLRQEFRTQHVTLKVRRTAANHKTSAEVPDGMLERGSAGAGSSETLVADNELSGFTFLPGAFAADTDEAAILHVRMQRSALGALGLPVNEERAGEWIQVDLLVGDDGLPQAVRLPQ